MINKKTASQIHLKRKELYHAFVEETNIKKKKKKWRKWQKSIPIGLRIKWHGICQYDANLINLIMAVLPLYGAFNLRRHLTMTLIDQELLIAHPSTYIFDEDNKKMGKHVTDILCNNGLLNGVDNDGNFEVTENGRKLKLAGTWEKFKKVEKLDFQASLSRNRRDKLWLGLIIVGALFTVGRFIYEIWYQNQEKNKSHSIMQIIYPSKQP